MAPISGLAANMTMKVVPLSLATLVQHFLRREHQIKDSKAREELLYDEAFTIVKAFMEAATRYTVEDLQSFSNTRIPPPPWVRTIRVKIPLTTCDAAADYLIKALGGKDVAIRTVGGTRWWQVRGLDGVSGEWMMVHRDIEAQRKRRKAQNPFSEREKARQSSQHEEGHTDQQHREPHEYPKEMEGTPCMLYIHGGGGYFGSIDQERYTMHRYARKMNGRVLAINYRLAPQYPFPCALQDALAAYLYLLDPPPGAHHQPVDPKLIIPAGDSAGGNLVLSLLQVIRDVGLPAPAGAVLISPWCDLTHSFPSCMTNAASDIIPPYGLSLHKPSPLWPPPNTLETTVLRDRFVERLKKVIQRGLHPNDEDSDGETATTRGVPQVERLPETTLLGDKISSHPLDTPKATTSKNLPPVVEGTDPSDLKPKVTPGDNVSLLVDGKAVTIRSQIQFYAMNNQLVHPLVSPAMGYLGGLPPCLIIASDKELLRDEIIYCAHKAAHPERYPVKEEARALYPALVGIEDRFGPTDVHLQVYDETCHVLPLYSFTTPAKFCYRAIAQFCKFVTKEGLAEANRTSVPGASEGGGSHVPTEKQTGLTAFIHRRRSAMPPTQANEKKPSLLRRLSLPTANRQSLTVQTIPKSPTVPIPPSSSHASSLNVNVIEEVASPLELEADEHPFSPQHHQPPPSPIPPHADQINTAGNPAVYACDEGDTPFIDHMIRERISTSGIIRALEPESDIPACNQLLEDIGVLNEQSVRRYLEGQSKWERKFASVARSIESRRIKSLKIARKEGRERLDKIRNQLNRLGSPPGTPPEPTQESSAGPTGDKDDDVDLDRIFAKTVLGSRQWTWGWALEGESPPPSSIVARADTKEARHLARFADQQVGQEQQEHALSGNYLWSLVQDYLQNGKHAKRKPSVSDSIRTTNSGGSEKHTSATRGRHHSRKSIMSWFRAERSTTRERSPEGSAKS